MQMVRCQACGWCGASAKPDTDPKSGRPVLETIACPKCGARKLMRG